MVRTTKDAVHEHGRLAALTSTAGVDSEDARRAPGAPVVQRVCEQLAAPFESTFRDNRGGVELEYITGEQCVSRLNQVLGPAGWSFTVREHGVNAEADEVWVLGELMVAI